MHGILLGAIKKLVTLGLMGNMLGNLFLFGKSEKEVDKHKKSIIPPHLINTLPQKMDIFNH